MTEQLQQQQQVRPPLRRSKDDRVIAGVCAGVARTLGIDPIIVRVLVAAFSLAGGAGIFAYIIAWILIPDDSGASVFDSRREGSKFGQFVIAVVLAAAGLAVISSLNPTDNDALGFLLFVLVAIVVWQAFGHDWFTRTKVTHNSTPTAAGITVAKAADSPVVTVTTPAGETVIRQEPPSVLGRIIWNLIVVLVGAMIASNWLEITTIPARAMLAIVLAVTGLGLVVSAFVGRARGLIALGIIVAVLTVTTGWQDGTDIGAREWAPVASLQADEYSLGMGDATLDLRDVTSANSEPVQANVGIGTLTVLVPQSAKLQYRLTTHVAIGDLVLPDGVTRSGSNLSADWQWGAADAPQVNLELNVSIGKLEVRYA